MKQKLRKKGMEMTTSTIIAIVLGLIILVILIIFIQQQVSKSGKRYEAIGKEAELAPDNCASLILGRYCVEKSKCVDEKQQTKEITAPSGGWKDCKSGEVCCPRF